MCASFLTVTLQQCCNRRIRARRISYRPEFSTGLSVDSSRPVGEQPGARITPELKKAAKKLGGSPDVRAPLTIREGEPALRHPFTVEPLTEALYRRFVKAPTARGNYPSTFADFLTEHAGATHGVFDAEGRLIYIGKESDLRAAHRQPRSI